MRIMFGIKAGEHGTKGFISDKIWCRLDENNNCYIALTPEEIQNKANTTNLEDAFIYFGKLGDNDEN